MKQLLEKNKKILIALGLLFLAAAGLTYAYYNSMKDFKNEFRTPKPGVAIHEIFDPSDYWVPGEEKSKKALFSNSGESDMLLRFKVDIAWDGADSDHPQNAPENFVTLYWKDSSNKKGDGTPDPIELSEASGRDDFDFVLGPDGYYYYKKVLKAEGSDMSLTQDVLQSVKFSEHLSNDGHANSNYSNVQINVKIQGETVLASAGGKAAEDEWDAVNKVFIGEGDSVMWEFIESDLLNQ